MKMNNNLNPKRETKSVKAVGSSAVLGVMVIVSMASSKSQRLAFFGHSPQINSAGINANLLDVADSLQLREKILGLGNLVSEAITEKLRLSPSILSLCNRNQKLLGSAVNAVFGCLLLNKI